MPKKIINIYMDMKNRKIQSMDIRGEAPAFTPQELEEMSKPTKLLFKKSINKETAVYSMTPLGYHGLKVLNKLQRDPNQFGEFFYLVDEKIPENERVATPVDAHDYDVTYGSKGGWIYNSIVKSLDFNTPSHIRNCLLQCFHPDHDRRLILGPHDFEKIDKNRVEENFKTLKEKGGLRLLDVAGGTGLQLNNFEKLSPDIPLEALGLDLHPLAKKAAGKKYKKYLTGTPARLNTRQKKIIEKFSPNGLMISAAIEKHGHLSPNDLLACVRQVKEKPGIFAFSIHGDTYKDDEHPIKKTLDLLTEKGILQALRPSKEYIHRRLTSGEPINYHDSNGNLHVDKIDSEVEEKLTQFTEEYEQLTKDANKIALPSAGSRTKGRAKKERKQKK